jgi:hypothetical protein
MTYSYHQLIAAEVKGPFEQILYSVVDRYLGTSCYKPTSVPKEELCFQCRCNIMTFSHQAKTYLHCGTDITHFATHYQHIAKGMNGLLLLPPLEFTYPLCSLGEQCAEEEKEILKGEEECISFKSKDVQLISQWVSFTLVHHV